MTGRLSSATTAGAVAVTGADGFIGRWICAELEAAGHDVLRVVHALRAPREARLTSGNMVAADVSDLNGLRKALGARRIEAIIHAASTRSAIADLQPVGTVAVNVQGVANVLELARQGGWRRSIILSSGSSYGADGSANSSQLTETTPISPQPRGIYGATKAAADLISHAYFKTYGIDGAVIRLSRVFGPGRRERLLGVDRLLRQAHQGSIVELDDWTRRTRLDCTYVRDVAHAVRTVYEADKLAHDLYNLSGGDPISGEDIVTALRQIYPGMRLIEREVTRDVMYPDERPPFSVALIESDLGWRPRYTLVAALRDYAEHLDGFEAESRPTSVV